jgi:endonuclease/exonuclease/phosphatase family metal-dependent hydrolase
MTTYNVGLALNFVPYSNERLAANVDLLGAYDTDVMCFQEVWLDYQVEAISDAVRDRLPHIYTVPPEQIFLDDAACTAEEVEGFADCARTQCPGLSGSALVACAPAQCGVFLPQLSPTCFDGVVSAVGTPDITVDQLLEIVTQPTGKFSYEGSLGLILASRFPLQNREFQDFIDDSSTVHRGALYADIQVGRDSYLVGCTHTTANLSGSIDYPPSGNHGSWQGENRFMQEQLIAFAETKAAGRPTLVAGDFNCGLANAANNVDAEWPANCRTWLDAGFEDPGAEQLPCTFCYSENTVLQLGGGDTDTFIDHIYVKNFKPATLLRAERVLDDLVSVEATSPPTELADEESPIMLHPSDHYGVELEVRR